MNKVFLKNVAIGPGRPKVAIPVMKTTKDELVKQISSLADSKRLDLIEWRADFLDELLDENGKINESLLLETVKAVADAAGKTPVCFTFRTKDEGGNREISALVYENMIEMVAASGYIDLIDVELLRGDELFKRAVRKIHSYHLHVMGSSHDFNKTPAKDEIIARLRSMQDLGADICKIAVMPEKKSDVFTLMEAAFTMNERYAQQPIVAISMGKEGTISRISGEFFGSAITFGSDEQASAPGQVEAGKLMEVLSGIHSVL